MFGLVAAACGDDDDDADEPPPRPRPSRPPRPPPKRPRHRPRRPSEETTAPTEAPSRGDDRSDRHDRRDDGACRGVEGKVTDFAAYVGGSGPADSSLEPVKVGYFNQQGGAVEVSHTNIDGVNSAVQYINEQAGGIGGHPLEIVTCFVANTEEEGQQCGQQFANDDSIVAVISGPTFIGTESFYAALDGAKPVIHGVSVSPADTVQEKAAVLFGGAKYILAPYATFARDTLGTSRRR